jgi:hypothetical protein
MIRLFSACILLCAFFISPASAQHFLEGVISINVTMTKEETCIASQYGVRLSRPPDGLRRTVQHLRSDGRAPHQALLQPRHSH